MVSKRSVAPARCTTGGDERIASGTTMDATRLAVVFAKIDEYAAGGAPMSGSRVAAICAMIEDGAGARKSRRNKRRRRRCVDSTRSYKHIGEIGNGNFGAVVMACHRKTGQTVAIKKFQRRGGGKCTDVGDVLREACFLAACSGHPNLVGLHTVARDPGTNEYSVVMEYVQGPSLRCALKERLRVHGAPFPEADVRRIVRQLLAGAEAMHQRRIIHRDIKPRNVLVQEDGGVVKICDYGIALCAGKSGPPYKRGGTLRYMAPEVLMYRSDYDERVDLWSIGCVMAELLSGKVLFEVRHDEQQHIDKIFDLLGTPAEETFDKFMSPYMAGKVLRRGGRLPPPRRESRLREFFPSDVLSQEGYDVLKGLLVCNLKERLTAAAALQLPWFTGVPASEVGATESQTQTALPFVRMLTSVWAFWRKVALPLIKLPRHFY